jgi:hypothetical protein
VSIPTTMRTGRRSRCTACCLDLTGTPPLVRLPSGAAATVAVHFNTYNTDRKEHDEDRVIGGTGGIGTTVFGRVNADGHDAVFNEMCVTAKNGRR